MSLLAERVDAQMARSLFMKWMDSVGIPKDAVMDMMEIGTAHMPMYEFHHVSGDGKVYLLIVLSEHAVKICEVLKDAETSLYECISCPTRDLIVDEEEDERNWMIGQTFKDIDLSPMCLDCSSTFLDEDLQFDTKKFLADLAEVTDKEGNLLSGTRRKSSFVKRILKHLGG